MSERDDLAADLASARRLGLIQDDSIASHLLAAGWSHPRVMATRTGVDDIAAERRRQIDRGYTVEHDQEHGSELLDAAVAYLGRGPMPWGGTPDPDDIPGNVAKAGALCAAYIDAVRAAEVEEPDLLAALQRSIYGANRFGETQGGA